MPLPCVWNARIPAFHKHGTGQGCILAANEGASSSRTKYQKHHGFWPGLHNLMFPVLRVRTRPDAWRGNFLACTRNQNTTIWLFICLPVYVSEHPACTTICGKGLGNSGSRDSWRDWKATEELLNLGMANFHKTVAVLREERRQSLWQICTSPLLHFALGMSCRS